MMVASRGTGLHVRCDVLAIYDCQKSKILALRRRFYVIVIGNRRNSLSCMHAASRVAFSERTVRIKQNSLRQQHQARNKILNFITLHFDHVNVHWKLSLISVSALAHNCLQHRFPYSRSSLRRRKELPSCARGSCHAALWTAWMDRRVDATVKSRYDATPINNIHKYNPFTSHYHITLFFL